MRWRLPTAAVVVVVMVLAAAGALAGLAIQGWAGAVTGAVVVALAGVVTGYVPVFQDRVRRRQAELERAGAGLRAVSEPGLGQSAPHDPGPGELVPGPSVLLRPEFGVVEFTGRVSELAGLRVWCEAGEQRSVRVITGPGGVGKTRLALKVAGEREAAGWRSVVVAAGREAGALGAVRAVTAGPVLLVVDYAETRTGLGDLLRAVLEDAGRVRLLLLARGLGEWWDRLREESPAAVARLLASADPVRLEAPVAESGDADLAAAAVPFFAVRMGVPAPAGVSFDLPGRRVPVLVLHAAALVAVLRSMTSPPGSPRVAVSEGVLGELLEHEARYWRRTAAAVGLPDDGRVLKAVTAAAVLLGAGDLEEAAAVAGRVPDLTGVPAGELRRWGRWLYQLYPEGESGRLGAVQPDLLAEHHAVTQLAADPGLVRAVLSDVTAGQAGQALTVLGRGWDLHEAAGPVIGAALRGDLAALAAPAAAVATRTQPRVGELLAGAFAQAPVTLKDLIAIAEALPYPSTALALAALAAVERIRREMPPDAPRQDVARWARTAGVMLDQAGRSADALAVTEEAAAIYRELAAASPDRYRPELARCLSNLGAWFSAVGRSADALAVTEEAAAIFRALARTMPGRYRPGLAQALNNLGICMSEMGRSAEALVPAQEAIAVYRELAAAVPGQYLPDLANALNNLGVRFWELGRSADAVPMTQEAVAIRRELAVAAPDRYRPDLADSLDNLGIWLCDLGRPADALPVTQEAVGIFRGLADVMPGRYLPDVAKALDNLGGCLSALGRPADALPVTQEAVGIFRGLADVMPDRYRPDLANALTNLGIRFSLLGRPADALPVTQEAVAIRRDLAAALPGRYRPDLARSLFSLGVILEALDRIAEAASVRGEAARIRDAER